MFSDKVKLACGGSSILEYESGPSKVDTMLSKIGLVS